MATCHQPSEPKIDWDDPEARRQLLHELVDDALALLAAARGLSKRPEDLKAMAHLLERVATRDIGRNPDGKVRLKRGWPTTGSSRRSTPRCAAATRRPRTAPMATRPIQ